MAGGGVGEAMLIGAAVGAGTGGVMSAVQDKDVGQGMLLGALGGAATGGIGSQIGGAAAGALPGAATAPVESLATTGLTEAGTTAATQELGGTALNQFSTAAADQAAQQAAQQTAQQTAQAGASDLAQVVGSRQGDIVNGVQTAANPTSSGTGIASGLTTGQQIGAATTGGISGLMAANGQPAPYQAPETETYNGPLSKFKMAGPQLSQYSYNPNSFQPSIAPGYADGGIATLQTGMFPQSQIDRMQFATPSQMPVSREIIGSDYDATINPYTGDLPRFAEGGGINFIHNLQPGGEFGDMTADIYGAVQEHKPQWLQDIEPGGFIGATVPGKLDWEEKKRKKEEEKIAQDRAAKEAQAAAMYNQMAQQGGKMARGGIADLGSYSDGGRLLRGPGDGMSDNIPASIAGKQPARLADGEFVVPADVVSHLGNGSTDAGAKTLYSMMDKVRKARTGSKKQGREINPNKYVPGMAGGGIACLAEGGETVEMPQGYQATTYTPQTYNYSEYTQAHRPSGDAPQYYGEIYRGQSPDYATPGYTLTGGNLGRWNNVAGEAARAAQPASLNQRITQQYLQSTGRAPTSAEVMGAIDRTQQFNEDVYLQNKAAQLKNIGETQFAKYTPQQLKDFIASKGMTLQEHYNKYGRGEGVSPFSSDLSFISQTPEAQSLGTNVRGATTGDFYNPYTYGAPQPLQTNRAQTVQSKTVQDLINESLAKYKEENPSYSPPSYDWTAMSGGNRGGKVNKLGIASLKRA